jgi:hypothetical protein
LRLQMLRRLEARRNARFQQEIRARNPPNDARVAHRCER